MNSKTNTLKIISNIFYILAFLSLAIFSSYNSLFAIQLKIPEISIFVLFIIISFICYWLYTKKIDFNFILLYLLLIREAGLFIGCSLNKVSYSEFFNDLIISFIIYFVYFFSRLISGKTLFNSIIFFSLIVSIELLITVIFNHTTDKNLIISAIGASNYAAAFLLLTFTLLINLNTTKLRLLYLFIITAGILCTKSVGCFVAMFIITIISIIVNKKCLFRIIKWWQYFYIVLIILMFFIINKETLLSFFTNIRYKLEFLFKGDLNSFSASRIELYGFTLNNIKNNLWFGPVVNYDSSVDALYRFQNSKAHNFLLESLVKYGLLGTLVNFIIVYYIIKNIKKNKKGLYSILDKALILSLIAILIHGLIEPNLFTMRFDIFVFAILGYLSKNTYKGINFKKNYHYKKNLFWGILIDNTKSNELYDLLNLY